MPTIAVSLPTARALIKCHRLIRNTRMRYLGLVILSSERIRSPDFSSWLKVFSSRRWM
jgi:hypothetical protein